MNTTKLRALLEASTPGPWNSNETGYVWFHDTQRHSSIATAKLQDAQLIVTMRNCLPELLAVVEEAQCLTGQAYPDYTMLDLALANLNTKLGENK